jgi:hypothetical protein
MYGHRRASLCEGFRDGSTDPGGRAGDQRNFIVETK